MPQRIACLRLKQPPNDKAIGEKLVTMTQQYARFGYRRAAIWVSLGGTRVRRLWRNMRLQQPCRRPRRRRTGSDIRSPRATMANSVWTYDFLFDRLVSWTTLKMLCVLDEHTDECLANEVGRWMRSQDVILPLFRRIKLYGKPAYIRSDNGAAFTATAVMRWLRDQNVGHAFITPGSP
jgi:transposase InsO family protein